MVLPGLHGAVRRFQPEAFDGRAPGGVTLQPLEARAERGERREGGGVLGVQGLDPLDGP